MTKREKVIEALEACVLKDPDDSRDCKHCPRCNYGAFITNSCINGVMADALVLLKAQEPRVLTLDEYKALAEKPKEERDPVWEEWHGLRSTWAIPNQAYGGYGTSWRCWTSRPTEEQMKAVKWE